ncbi:hypothetical protein BGX28_000542 [Mortierella sp. GBA30]|nr:hypothetical protein BGX28_000542 [Mortierella sp. GBA30]
MATINNSSSVPEIQEVPSSAPAIAFADEQGRRGRDHTVTPLIEEDIATDLDAVTSANKKSNRISLAAIADRFRSRSRSHSRHRNSTDLPMDRTTTQNSIFSIRSNASSKSRSGSRSRRSSVEIDAPYADVVQAQNEFMEKLRAEQEKNGATHNTAEKYKYSPEFFSFKLIKLNSQPDKATKTVKSRAKPKSNYSQESNLPRHTMSQNHNNIISTNVATIEVPRPSIQFSQHGDDIRGRDNTLHPLSGTSDATGISLTKTQTTDSTKSRRSSLAAFAERFRSRSRSKSRSRVSMDGSNSNRSSLDGDEFKYSRRRSSETGGPYADVIVAQALFMDKLREEQAKNNITHNADGLPIPPPVANERRRSSVTKILGMDKPLLAR